MKSLDLVLQMRVRLAVALAGLLLLPTFFTPLWRIEMYAQQFPAGLQLMIYPQKLVGGNDGQDLAEINVLNHYIGMQEIEHQNFPEMKWIPFAIGVFILVGLRAAVFGKLGQVLDLAVLFTYFGLFSLYSFYSRLYVYGHELSPEAPVKVDAFTPPIIGHERLANFDVYSLPGWGTGLLLLYGALLVAILAAAWLRPEWVQESRAEARGESRAKARARPSASALEFSAEPALQGGTHTAHSRESRAEAPTQSRAEARARPSSEVLKDHRLSSVRSI